MFRVVPAFVLALLLFGIGTAGTHYGWAPVLGTLAALVVVGLLPTTIFPR